MNVSRENVLRIFEEQEEHLRKEEPWHWKVQVAAPDRSWTSKDVEIWMKQLNSYKDLEFNMEQDILEVETIDGHIILNVNGIQHISEYCQNEYFETVPHEWKERMVLSERAIHKHYSIDINSTLYTERTIELDESTLQWLDIPKVYRQYKRMSYRHKQGFYIVFEYLRENPESYSAMRDADLASQQSSIQVYLQFNHTVDPPTNRIMFLIQNLCFMMKEITQDPYLLTIDEQKSIIQKYHRLINSVRELNRYEKQTPSNYFLAPKPSTLEKKNLVDPDVTYGVVSIQRNYAVTDKADGERMLLYVDEQGDVYLINNTFNVRKTGITVTSNNLHQSLFDGEYIPKYMLHDGSDKDIFAIFDVYYLNQESVMNLPLMSSEGKPNRYMKMKLSIQESYWETEGSAFQVEMKEHYHANGKEIFQKCKDILENKKRRYEIDGLIFTPIDLPVFGYYPNQFKKLTGKSVSWDRVLKWKPADQNTIDFLVKEQEEFFVDTQTNKRYKRFKLFTGYNASQWEDIPVWKGVQTAFYKDKSLLKDEEYQAKAFKPIENYSASVSIAFVPVNAAGQAVTEDRSIITDNMIVEFAYDLTGKGHPSMRWKANRLREDKTRSLRMTGNISKTANDLSVANSIWHNIHDPVTYEHIIGQFSVNPELIPTDIEERLLGTNDVYYARDIPRNHMLSVHMLNFHNYGIKSYLYSRPEYKDSILELACGMAGDLPRWRDNRYNFILGIDLVKNNIESPQGSYGRYLYQRNEFMKKQRNVQRLHYPQAIFLIGDCSLPLESGAAAKGKDYDSEALLKLLYMGKVTEKYSFLNQYRIPGRASRKFDVVSCQFAIHYFFKSQDRLEGFLRNVSFNLRPNGKFITTFMDGQKVHQLINKEGHAKGVKEGNTVWCIQKQYKSFTKANVYGRMIDVYLENTNHFIPEYLVHFDYLKEKAKEYNLEIVEEGFFGDTFQMLKARMDENDPTRNKFLDTSIHALSKDPEQTRFSFLNRWAIFRKVEEQN